MGGALGCVAPPTAKPTSNKRVTAAQPQSYLSSYTNARVVAAGQLIYCRLAFESKKGIEWRWRESKVTDVSGSVISVVVGPDPTKAEPIIVDSSTDDLFNLATGDMLAGQKQIERGDALSEEQRKKCCSYFDLTNGEKQLAAPQRHDDLPIREAEGLLDEAVEKLEPAQPNFSDTRGLLHKVVLCRDKFVSKNTKKTVYKWREAEITEVNGAIVKIHYTGWSENHDIWKNLETSDIFDLCPPDSVMSKEQGMAGGPLDEAQRAESVRYLTKSENPLMPVVSASVIASSNSVRRNSGSGRLHHSFRPGQQVEVEEVRRDKGKTAERTGRWRPAIINKARGDVIRVHFIGFDSSWDENIDMGEHAFRVRMQDSNSKATEASVGSLDGVDSPSQRRRKASRRASFDPSALSTYTSKKDLNMKDATVYSQKYNIQVEQQPAKTQRSSFSGDSRSADINPYRGPETETTETDTEGPTSLASWNAPSKSSNRRAKGKSSHQRTQTFPDPENRMIAIERYFYDAMAQSGYHVIEVEGDGNCLFRAVAHQIWLDESRHAELRHACVKHMRQHRSRYEVFCPMDYDEYLRSMDIPGTWADDFEIRALEEMLDRLISIYSSDNKDIRPINKNFDEEYKLGRHVRPIILSYHGGNHYNSVFDERSPLPLGPRESHVILDMRTGKG